MTKFILFMLLFSMREQGFSIKKISSKHPKQQEWVTEGDDAFLQEILSQPFTYLGSGNHTYAFASEDGEYVLKFFKQKHMRTHSLLPLSKEKKERRIKERNKSYNSYKIAYETLPELTGTLYLHLTKTSHLKKFITIIDQHKKTHTLNADKFEFLLQRRAKVGFAYIEELLEKKQKERALSALCSYLELIKTRAKKGISDHDRQLFKNYGFIGNRAIEIDIGDFAIDSESALPVNIQKELQEVSAQILDFVSTYAPELSQQIKRRIDQIVKST
ncbi:MAG: hypothetical protein SNF33_02085 [Candidatus Algichlamydia australiensis]|nr:hypothetical protein [Chlamydiales bacterium]